MLEKQVKTQADQLLQLQAQVAALQLQLAQPQPPLHMDLSPTASIDDLNFCPLVEANDSENFVVTADPRATCLGQEDPRTASFLSVFDAEFYQAKLAAVQAIDEKVAASLALAQQMIQGDDPRTEALVAELPSHQACPDFLVVEHIDVSELRPHHLLQNLQLLEAISIRERIWCNARDLFSVLQFVRFLGDLGASHEQCLRWSYSGDLLSCDMEFETEHPPYLVNATPAVQDLIADTAGIPLGCKFPADDELAKFLKDAGLNSDSDNDDDHR